MLSEYFFGEKREKIVRIIQWRYWQPMKERCDLCVLLLYDIAWAQYGCSYVTTMKFQK